MHCALTWLNFLLLMKYSVLKIDLNSILIDAVLEARIMILNDEIVLDFFHPYNISLP